MAIEKNNTLTIEGSGFSIFLNETIQNIKHTGALGLYCYLASQFSGFNICKKHLQNHFGVGEHHIRTCFKYLRNLGLIESNPIRNDNGQCIRWETILKLRISTPNHDTENEDNGDTTMSENHNVENPHCGKTSPIYKEININKESYIYTQNSDEDDFSPKLVSQEDTREVAQRPPDKTKKQKEPIRWMTLQDLLNDNDEFQIPEYILEDFIKVRKSHRKKLTLTAWANIHKKLREIRNRYGVNPIEAFEHYVTEEWATFQVHFFENFNKNKKRSLTIEEVINA